MNCFLGVDGGGTKTAYLLTDGKGKTLFETEGLGTSYRQHGAQSVVEMLAQTATLCMERAGISKEELGGVCVGLPCYGENPGMDKEIASVLRLRFAPYRLVLTNDVEVAWAGALACGCGINLVAGTGSIAFGCSESGETARCGGWSEHFSDEGSCYWAARKAMELFSKQADGRAPKGALYSLVREKLGLVSDFDFISVIEREYLPFRDKTASFQKLLSDAAEQGDGEAAAVYRQAAGELCLMAAALKRMLRFEKSPVPVSYAGGLFRAGALVLEPLAKLLAEEGLILQRPLFSPVKGAVLLAAKRLFPQDFQQLLQRLSEGHRYSE